MPPRLAGAASLPLRRPWPAGPAGFSSSPARSPAGGSVTKLKLRQAPPNHHATSAAFWPANVSGNSQTLSPWASRLRTGPASALPAGRPENRRVPAGPAIPPPPPAATITTTTDLQAFHRAVRLGRALVRAQHVHVQTICVTGMGESFSNCNSTIENVSSALAAGSSTTRRKTFPAAARPCSAWAATRPTSFLPPACRAAVRHAARAARAPAQSPCPFASNCQSRLASGARCKMLQVFQRDIGEWV